ncbi:hypothetical protein DPMN_145738 [Dreissena polymorpha]|uniref:Uncharacterized protein n=1 Tax=Dreissena polymorpha TaxID=45954 RepID=A0A9D4J1N5_DREPO|nr:hypothetical protein DPMN_145738 [Dreissena polymorpha]
MFSRTVKDAHGQSRHKYGFPDPTRLYPDPTRQLQLPFRLVLSSRIITVQHCNFPKLPCWPTGALRTLRTSQDMHGLTQSYTAATRFTCRFILDMNRVDPSSVCD